jgi:hypothetical protein
MESDLHIGLVEGLGAAEHLDVLSRQLAVLPNVIETCRTVQSGRTAMYSGVMNRPTLFSG